MKKKVVILSAFLSPLRSGAEACVEEVAIALSEQYDITIVTARHRKDLPKKDMLRGKVAVRRVGLGCSFDKWLYPFLAPQVVFDMKPDIIHAVLESFAGLAMMLCSKRSKAKRVLTCQSTNLTYKGLANAKWLVKRMHKNAEKLTVISRALQERAASYGRDDAVLIPNGVHLRDIPMAEKVFGRILFVGRLEPMKGIDTLLEAMTKLPDHARLRIVGDGSLRQKLQVQANLMGLEKRVTFAGFVPVPDVFEEYAKAEIFCGLSRQEALGNVFFEAQAAGCGVIGTNIEGIPDIIQDGENGLLVPPDNPEAAAAALNKLLDDQQLRHQLAEAGRENAKRFDWSILAKKYAEVYELL